MSDDESSAAAETVFEMDPERTMWALARNLVSGQRTLADMRRSTQAAQEMALESAAVQQVVANFAAFEQQWYRETLPSVVASFQLALEVFDTFGSGPARIDDPIEAAIWNNKFFVWFNEMAGPRAAE